MHGCTNNTLSMYFHTSLHKTLCRTTLPMLRRQLSCSLLKDNLLSHLKFKTKVIFKKTDVKLVTTMYGCSEVLKALYRYTHTDLTVLHQSFFQHAGLDFKFVVSLCPCRLSWSVSPSGLIKLIKESSVNSLSFPVQTEGKWGKNGCLRLDLGLMAVGGPDWVSGLSRGQGGGHPSSSAELSRGVSPPATPCCDGWADHIGFLLFQKRPKERPVSSNTERSVAVLDQSFISESNPFMGHLHILEVVVG